MSVNSLPKTVTRQRRDCDLNPGPSALESSTITTRLRPRNAKTLLQKKASCPQPINEYCRFVTQYYCKRSLQGNDKSTKSNAWKAGEPPANSFIPAKEIVQARWHIAHVWLAVDMSWRSGSEYIRAEWGRDVIDHDWHRPASSGRSLQRTHSASRISHRPRRPPRTCDICPRTYLHSHHCGHLSTVFNPSPNHRRI